VWNAAVIIRQLKVFTPNGNIKTALMKFHIEGSHDSDYEEYRTLTATRCLHIHPLLGNVLVNKFPRRQILGKESVARLRNNRRSCVFRVRGDVTTVDSDDVTCVSCPSDRPANRLAG
jgi:hypothetical protein